jgi:hypothetical protein
MRKIISLFHRNYDGDRLVRNEVVPGAEWVLAGEGVPTRKWDGTCCMIRGGKLYKRYEVKPGGKPPPNFEPANEVDENTGKQQGWVPVGDGPDDRWHREAFARGIAVLGAPQPGANPALDLRTFGTATYELCGPKVQGNPDGFDGHYLVVHGLYALHDCPRDFDGIKAYLAERDIEGVVWHHPDGRMVKIKAKDFGLKRRR